MPEKIRVALADDDQNIIDRYCFRLSKKTKIEVVFTTCFGDEILPLLSQYETDVLILDIGVSPILYLIPKLHKEFPSLRILVVSMLVENSLIKAIMNAGASSYVLKDDQTLVHCFEDVIICAYRGNVFSRRIVSLLIKEQPLLHNKLILTKRQLTLLTIINSRPSSTINELANRLHVSNSSIRHLLSRIYINLEVDTRSAAIAKAHELGLITSEPIYGFDPLENLKPDKTTYETIVLKLQYYAKQNVLWLLLLFFSSILFYVLLKILH